MNIREILNKINEVRTNPTKLANKITLTMSYINKRDNVLREPNKPLVKLNEGIKAYEEAITLLKNMEPLEEFIWEESLNKISQDHASDIGYKGVITNDSSDGRVKYQDRFRKFATFTDLEEILITGESDPTRIVMGLIICDGDATRTNRSLILSKDFNQIGIGFDSHAKSNYITVINLSKNWKMRQISAFGGGSAISNSPSRDRNDFSNNVTSKYSKYKDFQIDLTNLSQNAKETSNFNLNEELIEKYEKELDQELFYDDYVDKKEEKHIFAEGSRLKLLKKITFIFEDGSVRKVMLSKTWKI